MQTDRGKFVLLACVLALCSYLSPAAADGCRTEEEKQAAAQMKKAEDAERAGKLRESYDMAGKIDSMCLAGDGSKRHEAMQKRLGLKLGQQEEKQGRLDAAFDWYSRSRNETDADRVKMKQVNVNPKNRNLVSGAIDHFKRRNNTTQVAELRKLAAKNADLELANEEKAFAARKESFKELVEAKDWFYYVGEGAAKKAHERAEQRGDVLAREDYRAAIENALRYYNFADAKQKAKTLRDKAMRIGDSLVQKGDNAAAVEYYRLAGATDKAEELRKRTEKQQKQSEEKRQKQFSKEQDDLEKQLGM